MDFARYLFEQKRRLKESRKKAKNVEMKEIKLRPKIDPHDYQIKVNQMGEFLTKGHKVKVTMRYRPYEMRHVEIGLNLLDKITTDLAQIAELDRTTRPPEGARVQAIVLQKKKR